MGKGILIASVAVGFGVMLFMMQAQQIALETEDKNSSHQYDMVARETAMNARKLLLAHWVTSGGTAVSAPFQSADYEGGTMQVSDYSLAGGVLDFTVLGSFEGASHEIRSRYRWIDYAVNPIQLGVNKLNLEIDPGANLDVSNITLDDQGLSDMEEVLITELGLAQDLAELDLGMNDIESELTSELNRNGITDVTVNTIDQSMRDELDNQNGLFFPEQVKQAVNGFMLSNPGSVNTVSSLAGLAGSFGSNAGEEVLRIDGNLDVISDFSGEGILVVEGDFNVPAGINFEWEGLILVQPPSTSLNPQINLEGNVDITGSMVALQEGLPNTGHMDITSFRDYSGSWSSPYGVDKKQWYYGWFWCMYHRHDFTSVHGNSVVFSSSNYSERIHEWEHYFYQTLSNFSSSDSMYLEIFNSANHGRGILSFELSGQDRTTYPVAAGFDPSVVSSASAYKSKYFSPSDLEYLELHITRLSSLKKMWDPSPPEKYPGCSLSGGRSGPLCVGADHNRYSTLTLRLYNKTASGDRKVFETSLYWHRRTDEEEEFEENMNELVEDLNDVDYGMNITFGENVNFVEDASAISSLNLFGGLPIGIQHIGTWHRHIEADTQKQYSVD